MCDGSSANVSGRFDNLFGVLLFNSVFFVEELLMFVEMPTLYHLLSFSP